MCSTRTEPAARPDVVWFGEMPYHMDDIWDLLRAADIFAAIGTSGQVYPAAAFVQDAARAGAHTVEINLDPSAVVSDFAETRFGKASVEVPRWVDGLLHR
jgi:NAD-dependent deacetylase